MWRAFFGFAGAVQHTHGCSGAIRPHARESPGGFALSNEVALPFETRGARSGVGAVQHTYSFDKYLYDRLLGVIQQQSHGRPALVFCNSRSNTLKAATTVAAQARSA